MQKSIAQNHLRMQNDGSECVYRTLITPEINYLGFGMHIDRFGTIFEIQKIGLKNGLCAESEWKCLGVPIYCIPLRKKKTFKKLQCFVWVLPRE